MKKGPCIHVSWAIACIGGRELGIYRCQLSRVVYASVSVVASWVYIGVSCRELCMHRVQWSQAGYTLVSVVAVFVIMHSKRDRNSLAKCPMFPEPCRECFEPYVLNCYAALTIE